MYSNLFTQNFLDFSSCKKCASFCAAVVASAMIIVLNLRFSCAFRRCPFICRFRFIHLNVMYLVIYLHTSRCVYGRFYYFMPKNLAVVCNKPYVHNIVWLLLSQNENANMLFHYWQASLQVSAIVVKWYGKSNNVSKLICKWNDASCGTPTR